MGTTLLKSKEFYYDDEGKEDKLKMTKNNLVDNWLVLASCSK